MASDLKSWADSASFLTNVKVGGHRGCVGAAPENTIRAFNEAFDAGAQLIELDVALTRDDVIVVIHDTWTGRTANKNKRVTDCTWAELSHLQLTDPAGGKSEKISALEDVLHWAKKRNIKVVIDVKEYSEKIVKGICRLIRRNEMHSLVCVASFHPLVPLFMKKLDPDIFTGITYRRWAKSTIDDSDSVASRPVMLNVIDVIMDTIFYFLIRSLILPYCLGVDLILANHTDVSILFARSVHNAGFEVLAWTVNKVPEALFLNSIGVPFLTDKPKEIIKALNNPAFTNL